MRPWRGLARRSPGGCASVPGVRGPDAAGASQGKDVVELGCGTAYFGAWLKRRGAARVVGVDITPGAARDGSADGRASSVSGSSSSRRTRRRRVFPTSRSISRSRSTEPRSGAIPYKWIPEAARLLRPGGELVFLRNATLAVLCWTDDERGERDVAAPPARDCGGSTGEDDGTTEFQLGHGEWVKAPARKRVRDPRPGRAVRGRGHDEARLLRRSITRVGSPLALGRDLARA